MIVLSLAAISTASAHHGIFAFDHDNEMEITGVITEIQFVNPHTWLHLDVEGSDGNIVGWRCEMRSATVLRRSGWSKEMFAEGQAVTVTGSPGKLASTDCYLGTITFADGSSLDRYAQISKDAAVTTSRRPPRLANGDPNISGDWAQEQNVLTDSRGVSGSFVPLSVAEDLQAGGEVPATMMPFPGTRGHADIGAEVFNRVNGLTDAGMRVYQAHDMIKDNPRYRCEATSIIFDWTFDTHVNRIVQESDKIILKYGFMDMFRTIHMDQDAHPADLQASRTGHSIGRWEDDVLIVDTVGFEAGIISTMASQGFVPNSDQLHVVERFTLNDEKDVLTRSYVAEDSVYLAEPFTGMDVVQVADLRYEPYNCDDKAYNSIARPEALPL
jgi:hypothetical protein